MGQAAWGAEAAVVLTAVEATAVVALVEHLPTALGRTGPQPMGRSQHMVQVTAPLLQATLLQVRDAAWQLKLHCRQVGKSCWRSVFVHRLLTRCSST